MPAHGRVYMPGLSAIQMLDDAMIADPFKGAPRAFDRQRHFLHLPADLRPRGLKAELPDIRLNAGKGVAGL